MMTPPLVVALSFLYSFLISSALLFSDSNNGEISSYPKTQAEKLIRSLNLFPEHEVNRHRPESNDASVSEIVEKRFQFPFMEANNPVQDLGHHAGYYSLPHSKAAKIIVRAIYVVRVVKDPFWNTRWVHAMQWSGQKQFMTAKGSPFRVGGVDAGLQKGYGPLTFLKFYNSGHMVPMDQPEFSLEMLRSWMQSNLSSTLV
ncbi:Serine carboxypeptidase-like 47 [Striga hermonthica]|uniref:Serine carboxypeptidase-like 47 n=1 Tax=Striga hermonthica TaxID=68872 RepID=A0A9N7NNT4_STRHE|nr:Serine carboxypeptidase-like 47 [Striga hermonthica]